MRGDISVHKESKQVKQGQAGTRRRFHRFYVPNSSSVQEGPGRCVGPWSCLTKFQSWPQQPTPSPPGPLQRRTSPRGAGHATKKQASCQRFISMEMGPPWVGASHQCYVCCIVLCCAVLCSLAGYNAIHTVFDAMMKKKRSNRDGNETVAASMPVTRYGSGSQPSRLTRCFHLKYPPPSLTGPACCHPSQMQQYIKRQGIFR